MFPALRFGVSGFLFQKLDNSSLRMDVNFCSGSLDYQRSIADLEGFWSLRGVADYVATTTSPHSRFQEFCYHDLPLFRVETRLQSTLL